MKSKSTIEKRARQLRAFIDASPQNAIETRVAYEAECALLWVLADRCVGWPSAVHSACETAEIIRQEANPGAARGREQMSKILIVTTESSVRGSVVRDEIEIEGDETPEELDAIARDAFHNRCSYGYEVVDLD